MGKIQFIILVALVVFCASFGIAHAQPGPGTGGPHRPGQPVLPGYRGVFYCENNSVNLFQDQLNPTLGILVQPSAVDMNGPEMNPYFFAPPMVLRLVTLTKTDSGGILLVDGTDSDFKFLIPKLDFGANSGEWTQKYMTGHLENGHPVFGNQKKLKPITCLLPGPFPTGFSTGN